MKRILSLVVGCLLSLLGITARAQSVQVATLTSGDDVKIFMGHQAFKDAVAASVDGDIINLSAGVFDSPGSVRKALTIRGAGMGLDQCTPSVTPTIVNGDIWFYCDIQCDDVRFTSKVLMSWGNIATKASFTKSYIPTFVWSKYTDLSLIQCYIQNRIEVDSNNLNLSASNSYLILTHSGGCTEFYGNLVNCIWGYSSLPANSISSPLNTTSINCIIYTADGSKALEQRLGTSYHNCLFYGDNADSSYEALNQNGTNKVLDGVETVFSEEGFYELLEEYKSFKGNDGRQVGIHGGNLGFNVTPKAPKITSFSIASETDPDGTLTLGVTVEDAQ